MIAFLVAAVCVLTVVVLIDLFLSLAIITRLRQSTHRAPSYVVDTLPAGAPMPALRFDAIDGTVVDLAGKPETDNGRTLLAFVAAHCGPCHQQLPRLREIVGDMVARGERAVVVVLSFTGEASEYATAFAGLAPVVIQGDEERVSGPFEVTSYPTYVTFESGVRTTAYAAIDDLAPAAA
jgi:thiol-disulfide isomerase/thioredoxin